MPYFENQKKLVFVFDLHGVIFKLSPIKVLKEVIKSDQKLKLISLLFYPRAILKTYLNLKKGAIAEEVLLNLAKEFPQYECLIPLGFKIINAQKPIKQTIQIIKNLKLNGHKIYIFSNIGENSIFILKNEFSNVFNNFDSVHYSTRKNNYLKKPNPLAFENFINSYKNDLPEMIFIDDKQKNVDIAKQFGIKSILFKNPDALISSLKNIK